MNSALLPGYGQNFGNRQPNAYYNGYNQLGISGQTWNNPGMVQNQPMQQQDNTNIQWVRSMEEATGYPLPNCSKWALWDENNQTIYVKYTDMNGRSSMSILDYVDRSAVNVNVGEKSSAEKPAESADYVTKEQMDKLTDDFSKQISELQKKLNDFKSKVGNSAKKGVQ